jgi:hypothetical protein
MAKFLKVLFWIWGVAGLLIGTLSLLTTITGSVGVGTSAYISAGLLYWIGGMVLFGVGALMVKPV